MYFVSLTLIGTLCICILPTHTTSGLHKILHFSENSILHITYTTIRLIQKKGLQENEAFTYWMLMGYINLNFCGFIRVHLGCEKYDIDSKFFFFFFKKKVSYIFSLFCKNNYEKQQVYIAAMYFFFLSYFKICFSIYSHVQNIHAP